MCKIKKHRKNDNDSRNVEENQKEHVVDDEHSKAYNDLYALCYKLECKVNKISITVKLIAALTIIIALISIALSIGNAVAGCGCKHAPDCKCASGCLSGWGVAALVLGIISALLSLIVSFIGIKNDVSKEQVFGVKQSTSSTQNNVRHNENEKKGHFDIMNFYYGLIFFFSFFAAIFSFTLLLLHFQ